MNIGRLTVHTTSGIPAVLRRLVLTGWRAGHTSAAIVVAPRGLWRFVRAAALHPKHHLPDVAAWALGLYAAVAWTIPGNAVRDAVTDWLGWNVGTLLVERSLEMLWRSLPL